MWMKCITDRKIICIDHISELKDNNALVLVKNIWGNDVTEESVCEAVKNGCAVCDLATLRQMCSASEMLRKTYFDKVQNRTDCTLPFEMFYINPHGNIWLCPCFGEVTVGNVLLNAPEKIWENSNIAKIFRLSIINNTYSFCDRRCEKFWNNPDVSGKVFPRKNVLRNEAPSKVLVAFDRACNLRCKSCRPEPYFKNNDYRERIIMYFADELIKSGYLEKCEELTIGGDGETFLSNGYQRVLFSGDLKRKGKVSIMTNGTLFTPAMWEQLEGKYSAIEFSVSVDATTEETYKKVRGGNFNALKKNLLFLSELRKDGKVQCVTIKLIAQRDNWREMKDFILMGKELGFDKVYLSPIWNWGTYSKEEFREISIFENEEETEMKQEIKAFVEDELFKDPIVDVRWNR